MAVISRSTQTQQESAQNIDKIVRETSQGSSDVAKSVGEISNSSKQVAADVEQVSAEADVMTENVEDFRRKHSRHPEALLLWKKCKDLSNIGDEMEGYVKKFKTD